MNTIRLQNKRKRLIVIVMLLAILATAFLCLLVGSSNMSIRECLLAFVGEDSNVNVRIVREIRIPRILAAIISGAGLSIAGMIMQTNLNNAMASPSTLGVSNAAVFGANLSIIAFAEGYITTGNTLSNYYFGVSPYATSMLAFVFSVFSILVVLGLCRLRDYSPGVIVLAGIAIGSVWTAATTILQFYATDVGLSAAVIWNFGDLGRATYKTDAIMFVVVLAVLIFFMLMSSKYNAMLAGDAVAKSMGINVDRLRLISLLLASVITAVCVSFLGIIGFVGIICPHITKKLIGQDHKYAIPTSALVGSLLILVADTLSRSIGNGAALPVGAVTSLLGAPFFLSIIFSKKEGSAC